MPVRRTRIKVCGMTRPGDIEAAAECGVDAVGLVFYPSSARHVSVAQAAALVREVPVFVDVVALFVDPDPSLVQAVVEQVGPDLLQFHGDEDAAFCAQFQRPYLKALRVQAQVPVAPQIAHHRAARGILLDTYQAGIPGGTGRTFNWDLIPDLLRTSIVLAGGLTPANVARAVSQVQPWAVDVSGGVERAKGIKDADLIKQFVVQVRAGTEALGRKEERDWHE
jgi:phosphoribosylanthranilate isomerase